MECTISGAASKCSQKAISVRCVTRLRSDMSNFIAARKTAMPNRNETPAKGCTATKPLFEGLQDGQRGQWQGPPQRPRW